MSSVSRASIFVTLIMVQDPKSLQECLPRRKKKKASEE